MYKDRIPTLATSNYFKLLHSFFYLFACLEYILYIRTKYVINTVVVRKNIMDYLYRCTVDIPYRLVQIATASILHKAILSISEKR